MSASKNNKNIYTNYVKCKEQIVVNEKSICDRCNECNSNNELIEDNSDRMEQRIEINNK